MRTFFSTAEVSREFSTEQRCTSAASAGEVGRFVSGWYIAFDMSGLADGLGCSMPPGRMGGSLLRLSLRCILSVLHLVGERLESLHDFVDAQGLAVNGLDLRERLLGKLAGLEEQEFGVTDHGGKRVVNAVLHVRHVTAEGGVLLVAGGFAFGLTRKAQGFGAAKGFAGDEK